MSVVRFVTATLMPMPMPMPMPTSMLMLMLIQANLYLDTVQKGLVPLDEIPLCHCRVESGCDEDCIK